jgi:hypothetical protein
MQRVADHYQPLWQIPVERRGLDADRLGLHLWDVANSPWHWPSWQRDEQLAAATLYLPLGYERVVGDIEPERAALPLARALAERPSSVLEMTAPFVIASLAADPGRLRLHTDALGIGRLFELRFPTGWVWSNRPTATCRFAGTRAEADRDGWRMLAACGWFIGDRTPLARVFALPGGTTIDYDSQGLGRIFSRVDGLAAWSADRSGEGVASHRVDQVAEALIGLVASLDRMSSGTIVADLSGGRDSRIVVAAALAAGLTVTLNTGGAEPGEADVAEGLVAALPAEAARRVTHRISRPKVTGPAQTFSLAIDAPIVPNVLGWHRDQEGLRSPTYAASPAPTGLVSGTRPTIGGAAGEIAKGQYYPSDHAQLGQLPWGDRLDALLEPLGETHLDAWGVSAVARATATARVRRTLEEALIGGLSDAKVLDYFYAAERVRRWGTTAERCGKVNPLLVPEFIRAAFDLTPDQRRENALHRAVTARLMPEWKDKPYYRRPAGAVPPALTPRLGTAVDRDLITSIVADSAVWADGYDTTLVAQSWRSLLDGRGRPADERLMQRVIWRAVFSDYLDEVNDEAGARRIPLQGEVSTPLPRSLVRGRRFAARGLRKLARMVEPHNTGLLALAIGGIIE